MPALPRARAGRLRLCGTGELTANSDLDLLVDFEVDAQIGFLALARMQRELAGLAGRQVDLVPKSGLKPAIRDSVTSEAQVIYAT